MPNEGIGEILASLIPTSDDEDLNCPQCGSPLTATVSIYTPTRVYLRRWSDGRARVHYKGDLVETKKAMLEQAKDNYADGDIDEREEIHCSNADCDYWARPVELEFPSQEDKVQ